MRSSAKQTHPAIPLLAALLLVAPRWANAHDEITLFSNQDGTGKLVVADFDPDEPVQVFEALCIGGLCLYTSSSPGIVAPAEDRPSESLFGLHGPKTVSLEIVAAHTAASLRVGATVLSAPGQSAALGTAPDLHAHGEWRVLVSQGTYGQFPIRFKLKAPGYADSDPIELLLSNATPSPTPSATPSPAPSPPLTPSPALSTTPTPAPTGPTLAHFLLYRAKGSKLPTPADHHRFPKNWHLLLDDVGLADEPPGAFPDDPENYTVKAVTGLANPARKNAEAPPPSSSQPYLRYGITEAKEGAGAPRPNGRFPKAVPAPPRLWGLSNQFGSLNVETGKVRSLWIPASVSETGTPPAPSDATHYLCYQAKASKLPSDQAPDTRGSGKGSFRKDLQAFVLDGFEDCASLADGRTVPFAGTAVAGTCLVDIKAPRELCRPAAKSAVVAPRTSAAQVEPSTPAIPDHSLLCYKVVLATQMRSATAGALGGLPLGTKLAQAKLPKREARFGTAVATSPGNGFPRPRAADLKALEQLCVPTIVDWVAER